MYKRFLLPPSVAFLTLISVATGCDGGTSSGGTGGAGNNGGGGTGGATGGTGGATGGTGGATGGTGGATGGTGGATGGTGGTGGMNPACVDAPGAPPALQLTPFVSGLNRPVLLTHAPGDPPSRMYVIEQPGLIRIIENGVLLPTPFLDVTALTDGGTSGGSEQGLLGLAFHPNFAQNGRFFIYYSGDPPGQPGYNPNFTIAEYARSAADPLVANAAATAILIEEPDSFSNHNGGMMAFGADGLLYVGVGDEGDAGDPFQNAQNPDVMFGKMLRLDVETSRRRPQETSRTRTHTSGISASGTRGASRSIRAPTASTSATSARARSKRSTSRSSARGTRTTAGTARRATWTSSPATAIPTRSSRRP